MPNNNTRSPGSGFAPLRQPVFAVLWAATVLATSAASCATSPAPGW